VSWRAAQRRAYRASDGVEIAYWFHSVQAPRGLLIFLHGAASNHTRWDEFLHATALTGEWNVVSPDLRGHGLSSARGDLSIARHCDDLVRLLDLHPASRVALVGHSLGANLALHFTARHPGRVSNLVLVDPVMRTLVEQPVRRTVARGALRVLLRVVQALGAVGVRRGKLAELDLTRLDRRARELIAAGREAEMRRLYSSTLEDLKYVPVAVYLQDVLNVLEPLPAVLPSLPALMLLSTGDETPELANNRRLARQLGICRVVEISCNHWIMTVAPEQARAAIEDYFQASD
jgi:pimeloyl-ACP methyl ester carboxylesterase